MFPSKSLNIETSNEFAYNSRHFLEAIEGLRASPWFYLTRIPDYYGITGGILVLAGLWFLVKKSPATLISVVFVYVFFSLAATKMPAFTFWISSVMILYGGIFIASLIPKIPYTKLRMPVVAVIVCLLAVEMNIGELYKEQTLKDIGRQKRAVRTKAFQDWAASTDSKDYVVVNLPKNSNIIFMFYTDAIGFDRELTETEVKGVESRGKVILDWEDVD